MLNKVEIEGSILFDPDYKLVGKDKDLPMWSALIQHTDPKSERKSSFRVKAFGKVAEAAQSAGQWDHVVVKGRLNENRWEDKVEKGKWNRQVEINAFAVEVTEAPQQEAANSFAQAALPTVEDDDEIPF